VPTRSVASVPNDARDLGLRERVLFGTTGEKVSGLLWQTHCKMKLWVSVAVATCIATVAGNGLGHLLPECCKD